MKRSLILKSFVIGAFLLLFSFGEVYLEDEQLVAAAMIAGQTNTAFNDVGKGHRFLSEINFLSEAEIIFGYNKEVFAPDDTVTRAAAATMIGRALGLDGAKRNTEFPDVRNGNNASGFIQSALEKGIIQGFNDGTFRPDDPVTRAQMAIFLARAFDLKDEKVALFTDVPLSATAYPSIRKILSIGITEGYPDGTFRPDDSLSRADFSAFLARALNETFRNKTQSTLEEDIVALERYLQSKTIPFNGTRISLGDWDLRYDAMMSKIFLFNYEGYSVESIKRLDELHASGDFKQLHAWAKHIIDTTDAIAKQHHSTWTIDIVPSSSYKPTSFSDAQLIQGENEYKFLLLHETTSYDGEEYPLRFFRAFLPLR